MKLVSLSSGLLFAATLMSCPEAKTAPNQTASAPSTQPVPRAAGVQPIAPAAPQGIPARGFSVADYGAVPDDGSDDTKAIQSALDAASNAGGGNVLFPAGRYDVSIQPISSGRPHPQALVLHSKLRLAPLTQPSSVVLRLAEGQGNYESVFGTAQYGAPLEDFVLDGFTVDGNGQHNPVVRPSSGANNSPDFGSGAMQTPRYALRVYLGKRVLVKHMRFTNQTNVNVITFNGSRVSDAEIRDSSFEGVGNESVNGATVDFDHSSIYTNGPRMRVVGNRFSSRRGAGTPGARTAIETHDVDQLVEGNTIDGFLAGINVVGGGTGGGERQLYRNNIIRNVNTGFLIWSNLEQQPVRQAGLRGVTITGNTVQLNNLDWLSAKLIDNETRATGVSIEGQSDANISGLEISGNTVEFGKMQPLNPYRDQFSNGIQLWSYKVPNMELTGLKIRGNRITGALGAGIRSDVVIAGDANVIADNTTINPVLTDQLNYPELDVRQLRSGLYIKNRSRNLSVTGNTVTVEAGAKSDLQFGIAAVSVCDGHCTLEGNTLNAPGVTPIKADSSWTVK